MKVSECHWVLARAILIVLGASVLAGCSDAPSPGTFAARVGDAVLTEKELADRIGPGAGAEARAAYVDQWIADELLFREALRRGIQEDEPVARAIADARRRLLISALLERIREAQPEISDDSVAALYASADQDYRLDQDVALISALCFSTRQAATAFRERALGGEGWDGALRSMQSDSAMAPALRHASAKRYATRGTIAPEELWKLARTLPPNEISFVVTAPPGFWVMMVHGLKRQGEKADLAYIREDIRTRMAIMRQQAVRDNLLRDLRQRTQVETGSSGDVHAH